MATKNSSKTPLATKVIDIKIKDANSADRETNTVRLPAIGLRGLVMFPKMVLNFDVGRKKSLLALNTVVKHDQKVFLVAQKDLVTDDPGPDLLYKVGVVAEVKQILRTTGDTVRVLVEGLYRAKTVEFYNDGPYFEALVEPHPLKKLKIEKTVLSSALMRTVKSQVQDYSALVPRMPRELLINIISCEEPVELAEMVACNLNLSVEDKQQVLEQSNPTRRLEILNDILENEISILSVENEIFDRVKDQIDKNQREYFLREQMKIISEELGDSESPMDELENYKKKIAKLNLSDEAAEKLLKEVDKLGKMPGSSQEASVVRGYLDTCLELPWNTSTVDKIDIAKSKKQLDKDHYGLKKVKERILELLAVRKLAPDIKGQIICLVGPPGVGKTSVAKSIAAAMGRKYTRLSLGGVRDEADIRGHRKTYVGAMPGRIINAVKLAGSKNPLILLDEIDKMGNDFRGDPASAMLEVLDPEQNVAFRDHYIEIPFDLSNVLFIATANNMDTIPAPLLDRMEIIHLSSYTREEKFHIVHDFLISKQSKRHGLNTRTFKLTNDAIYSILDFYTREAGVREAERTVASLCRKAAKQIVAKETKTVKITAANIGDYLGPKKYRPDFIEKDDCVGLVNGLAWTSVGGEMLQIELATMPGSGKIELTGSLGDVMKESARICVSLVRTLSAKYGIDSDFYKNRDIHIHAPEGAVPKDGPSAGVTMTTALVSALTGIAVDRTVAMTGEISLRGRVLPIGGLKEKAMAAYRAGVSTVIIPKDNEPDLAEIDEEVLSAIKFIPVDNIDEVLKIALKEYPQPKSVTINEMTAIPVMDRSETSTSLTQ
ncbi:MAG: endopeptidase La [Oscillospiraceae bacterium]|nr:endopeptidase La [Oscillospiraceae bacterium]